MKKIVRINESELKKDNFKNSEENFERRNRL